MLPLGNTVTGFFENRIGHKERCHHVITGWINSATDSENEHTYATICFTDLNSLFDTRYLKLERAFITCISLWMINFDCFDGDGDDDADA